MHLVADAAEEQYPLFAEVERVAAHAEAVGDGDGTEERLAELLRLDLGVEPVVLEIEMEEAFILLGAVDDRVEVVEFLVGPLRRADPAGPVSSRARAAVGRMRNRLRFMGCPFGRKNVGSKAPLDAGRARGWFSESSWMIHLNLPGSPDQEAGERRAGGLSRPTGIAAG